MHNELLPVKPASVLATLLFLVILLETAMRRGPVGINPREKEIIITFIPARLMLLMNTSLWILKCAFLFLGTLGWFDRTCSIQQEQWTENRFRPGCH